MLKIRVSFVIVLEIVEDIVLPELEPEHVNTGVIGVVFLDSPPGSCCSEDGLDESTVIALSAVQHVILQFFGD